MNFKLGMQTQHEDPHQRQAQWPPRSKVKVAMSRDASDRCWPISRERNDRKTKIGKTVAHSTGNNAQQFQGQRRSTKTRIADKTSAVTIGQLLLRAKLYHSLSTERKDIRTSELVPQCMRCKLSRPAIKLWSWVFAGRRGIGGLPCRPHPAATQLVSVRSLSITDVVTSLLLNEIVVFCASQAAR